MNKEKDMENKNRKGSLADRIPHQVWLLISFAAAMALWTLLSVIPATSRAFPNVFKVLGSIKTMIDRGVLWKDISSSLISVISGYALGFVIALPVAILMAWYKPVRFVIEPWIQFIRNIPPLAYVPLIVIAAGVGRKPQIIVITIACFLIMCVTIYQGVTLGRGVFCGPSCVFTNDLTPRALFPKGSARFVPTVVEDGASIGANATVVCGHRIGRCAMIGAGAVVACDVPPHVLMLGVPARPHGFVCTCGALLRGALVCPECGRRFLPDGEGLREVE